MISFNIPDFKSGCGEVYFVSTSINESNFAGPLQLEGAIRIISHSEPPRDALFLNISIGIVKIINILLMFLL